VNPRPHWGKVFTMAPSTIRSQFPRFGDFQALVRRYDPAGTLRNEWLDAILGS
jgi:xylitol oxidase